MWWIDGSAFPDLHNCDFSSFYCLPDPHLVDALCCSCTLLVSNGGIKTSTCNLISNIISYLEIDSSGN